MSKSIRNKPWMFAYAIIFGLLSILFVYDTFQNHFHPAYVAWSGLVYTIMFAGNLVYSLNLQSPSIRKIWKFVFPIVLLEFFSEGIISSNFNETAEDPFRIILVWGTGFALFFPSFRAHYLLGYGKQPTNHSGDQQSARPRSPDAVRTRL